MIKKSIIRIVFQTPILWKLYCFLNDFIHKGKLKVQNNGYIRIKKQIKGKGNELIVGENTKLNDTIIHMIGNNNKIIFGSNVRIGPACSFWAEGSGVTIIIGDNVTFTERVHINAQEDNSCIKIGKDCMLSNSIIIRTSDSHPIYSLITGERTNPAKNIVIGDHVWIAPKSTVMKGVTIGDGSIIGSDTIVTKDIPENSLAVGSPARVVRTDIKWTREDIIFK